MRCFGNSERVLSAAAMTLFLASCGGNSNGLSPSANLPIAGPAQRAATFGSFRPKASGKIQHVVIIVQENRSFDNLLQGFPGADTKPYGYTSTGSKSSSNRSVWKRAGTSITAPGDSSPPVTVRAASPARTAKWTVSIGNTWDAGIATIRRAPINIRSTATCRRPSRNRTSKWATSTWWPTGCSPRTSTPAASSRISTSSPGKPVPQSTIRTVPWGCDGGPSERIGTVTVNPPRQYGGNIRPCFDNQTLGDELDTAGLSWGFYTASLNGDGNIWSAYQAIDHIYQGGNGPDWKSDVITPQSKFLNDVNSEPSVGDVDHADVRKLGPCGLRFEHGTGLGDVAGQRDRQVEVLEFHRHLHHVGRLRRLVRSRAAAVRRLRRPRHALAVDRHFALRQAEVRLARSVRARQHSAVRRGSVRAAAFDGERLARDLSRSGLFRFLATAAALQADSIQPRPTVLLASTTRSAAAGH